MQQESSANYLRVTGEPYSIISKRKSTTPRTSANHHPAVSREVAEKPTNQISLLIVKVASYLTMYRDSASHEFLGATPFVTYEDFAIDHDLWLTGEGARMICGERPVDETITTRP